MAFGNKPLQTAFGGKIAPQYFNQGADQYEVTRGQNGAPFNQLVNTSGTPIDPVTLAKFQELLTMITAQNSASTPNNVAITPSDTQTITTTRGIYVGVAGNIKIDSETSGTGIVFSSVPSGTILPVRATRVYATGTTATNLVAMW